MFPDGIPHSSKVFYVSISPKWAKGQEKETFFFEILKLARFGMKYTSVETIE